jgi:hypothetical protein
MSRVTVFDYEASTEEYRRRQAERLAARARPLPAEPDPPPAPPPAAPPPRPATGRGQPEPPPPAPPVARARPARSPGDPDPERAAELLEQMRQRLGWVVAVTSRADVERQLGRSLTPDEWRRVRDSRWWSQALPDAMREGAGTVLPAMLAALGLGSDDGA